MLRIKRPFIISFFGLMAAYLILMTGLRTVLWAGIALLSLLFFFFSYKGLASCKVLLILLFCSLLSLTSFTLSEILREKKNRLTGFGQEVQGTVTEIYEEANGIIRSAVLSNCIIDNTKIYSKIKVYPDKEASFSYGDKLCLTADELFVTEGEGIFRYHTLSDRCHLACTYEAENSTVTKAGKNLYNKILEFKGYSSKKLQAALCNDSAAVSQALFTGSRDNLSPELTSAFRICGISHIFAVSGMHLSLWTGMFFIILKKRAKLSFIPNILAILFVIFYTVFTGFSPSVLRAGIMLISVFTGRLLRRRADPLNSLGLSGTILTVLNPYLAGNVSFLLSFTATAAIALGSEYLLPEKKIFHGTFRKIKNKMLKPYYDTVTSLAVIIATLPVVSLFFGYASLLSPIASLIVTPLAEAVMILSSFIVLVPSGNTTHTALSMINEAVCGQLTKTVTKLSEADFMIMPVNFSLLLPVFIITAALCAVFLILFRERKKALICILSGVLVFTGLTDIFLYNGRAETEIMIFGKENATLISVSDSFSHSAIIGSGGSFSLISELSRHLNGKGITKTDLLLIPRDKPTENKNTDYLKKAFLPVNTVMAYDYVSPVSISLWDGCRLYAYTAESFCAISLYIKETKIVICPLPTSVFGDEHREFLSGDILICRSDVPETLDTDAFNDVIIVTELYKEHLSPFVSSIDRNLTITVKGDSYALC